MKRTDALGQVTTELGSANVGKEDVVIPEETIERKPAVKTRVLVTSFLALAALGTHWLPGRTIVAIAPEPQRSAAVIPSDKLPTGPNSLLGDAVADRTSEALAGGEDLNQYHLERENVLDRDIVVNEAALLNGTGLSPNDLIVADINAPVATASAVPEPATAGLLLLAAAPVVVRRKKRNSRAA